MRPILCLAAALSGCAASPDGGDPLDALPPERGLTLALPSGVAAAKAAAAEPAPLYVLTRQASQQVNGMVGQVLRDLWSIAHTPPAAQGDGWAMWGPFTAPLAPAAYRLVVQPPAYHLDIRRKRDGDADFRPLLVGTAGAFSVDLALGQAIDPIGYPDGGRLDVGYDLAPARVAVRVRHDGQAYAYDQTGDGAGDFGFAAADVAVRAAWDASGAGRAEARAPGGGVAVQCWDASFTLVACAVP